MRFGRIRDNATVAAHHHLRRHQDAVLNDRVALLYARLPSSLTLSFAAATVFMAVHVNHQATASAWPWLWLAGMAIVLLLRGAGALAFARQRSATAGLQRWLMLHRSGASVTAGMWGAAGLLFYPVGEPTLQAFTILMLCGVAAGALSVMAADFSTYRAYVALCLVPVAVLAMSQGSGTQVTMGLLILLLVVFLGLSAHANSRSLIDALSLHRENGALVERLEQEKRRVQDDAETMMGKVLSSAPIALWALDDDGIVTFMEGNQLGEQTGLQLPGVGENLFAVFATQPQVIYETRRALAGESFVTEIEMNDSQFEVHYSPLLDEDGVRHGAIGVAIDISERKRHERELAHRAHFDQLTGLPNRTLIMNQIDHAFDSARRQHRHVALFFLDLDNFKAVNDSMGHAAGDELLRQAAARLRSAVRESDMPARLGGDEFLVVSEALGRPEDAEVVAHKIATLFQRPFRVEQREVFATTSIGIAVYPQDGDNAARLLQSADTAMYHAKSAGKNKYRFFTRQMQDTAERHLAMESELRRALERGELELHYQPKYDTRDGRIHGAEALLRWVSPTLGKITPDDFIPVAEFAGLMPKIGDWVLRSACREAAGWAGFSDQPLHVAINVSPQQFRNTDLLANVTQALVETGIEPSMLELEITESVLVEDAPETMRMFNALGDLGVTLTLDDFGTGYSSLSYLKKFPMKVLKIDKSFIQDLGNERDDDSLVDAIIAMAHSLDMQIVAEGVETQAQLSYLQQQGVELVQGYYFSRPVAAADFRAMLAASTNVGSDARRA